ncbi:MAG: hypothetical protein DCC52_08295 [Chloroflexi bacterium]|nr:MAG: hypothetical protein DCC52_08295 [Chloroflexota bacterium]
MQTRGAQTADGPDYGRDTPPSRASGMRRIQTCAGCGVNLILITICLAPFFVQREILSASYRINAKGQREILNASYRINAKGQI